MPDLEYLSYSRISTFMTCPLRFQFRYVDRIEPEFTASALVFGTAIHASLASFYRSRMDGVAEPSHEALMATYDHAWHEATVDSPPVQYKDGEDAQALRSVASAMLGRFQGDASSGRVVRVEVPFRVRLDDGLDLVGVVDLVEMDDEGQVILVDHKTSARRYADQQAQDALQLGVYALAYEALTGQTEHLVRYDVLLKSKNGEGGVQRIYGVKGTGDVERTRKLALTIAEAVERGVFYPIAGWQCAGCEFRATCDRWHL